MTAASGLVHNSRQSARGAALLRVGENMQYEIRSMSFGEILDTGFRITRNHFVPLVGLAALVHVPAAVINGVLGQSVQRGSMAALVLSGTFSLVLFGLLNPFVQVAITRIIGGFYQGEAPSIGEGFREAFRILFPLLGTSLLGGLLTIGGMILLVIPGLWVMFGLVILSPVMVLEHRFGRAGIRRSLDLMKGERLRAFGILLLVSLIVVVLGSAFGLASMVLPYAGSVAAGLAQAVGTAFGAAVLVVLYFEIRCRKEGFEIEHLARLVQQGTGPARTALS